jgi:D-3-phosphoglycerate dehydrogenase
MIGEKELRLMKKTAYIVNTSRGSLIDSRALYTALSEGWIAGAALDVWEKEPPGKEEPLLRLPNVIATPHIAWYSEESLKRLQVRAAEEVARVLRGEKPRSPVNLMMMREREREGREGRKKTL